jgi:hypothetical protein
MQRSNHAGAIPGSLGQRAQRERRCCERACARRAAGLVLVKFGSS